MNLHCKMGGWRIFWPSFESTYENVKNNSYCILEAGVSNSKYLVIVSPDCWNLSPTCVEVRPVTQVYRKMASCSSKVTFFKLLCPILCSVMTSSLNTGSSILLPAQCGCALDDCEVALEPKLCQTIWMCDKAAFRLVARYQLSALWLERRG